MTTPTSGIDRMQLQAEVARLRRLIINFSDIITNHCIAMQAAVIDASVNDSDKGMTWIRNTLFGPGLLPDVDQAIELSETNPAQAWFDAETDKHEAMRAKHPFPESPTWPAGMPPASWDVYAMHEGMRLASSGSQASFSQRVNQLHAALTEAMWFAAPGGEPSYATEPTVDLPKIGVVPASLANTPGIQALVRWANSGTVIDKQVCWDTTAMFDVRDALVAALAKGKPASTADQTMQPIVTDDQGTVRFRENKIVTTLLGLGEKHGFDLNQIAAHFQGSEHDADRRQFAQLIGYSVSGYGDLSYVDQASREAADAAAEQHMAEGGAA